MASLTPATLCVATLSISTISPAGKRRRRTCSTLRKRRPIQRAVDRHRRVDAIPPQRGHERLRLPSERHGHSATLAARSPGPKRRAMFVEKPPSHREKRASTDRDGAVPRTTPRAPWQHRLFLLRGMAGVFFLRVMFVPRQEPPHRRIAEADAVTLSDFLPLQDRQVRLRLDLREDEIGVRLDALRSADRPSPYLARRLPWSRDALRPANHDDGADIKPRCGLTARHSAGDRLHHLLANIHPTTP